VPAAVEEGDGGGAAAEQDGPRGAARAARIGGIAGDRSPAQPKGSVEPFLAQLGAERRQADERGVELLVTQPRWTQEGREDAHQGAGSSGTCRRGAQSGRRQGRQ